jgi:recombination protein RecR
VHHLLGEAPDLSNEIGAALSDLHHRVTRCSICRGYAIDGDNCRICGDPKRDPHTLCVVARVPDLEAIERGGFRGRYHVLHALLAPLDGWGPERIDVAGLRARVHHEQTREVILALPTSVDGEATAQYVAQGLRWQPEGTEGEQVRITRIATGMSFGHELEFADPITIDRAMQGRRAL